MDILILDDNQDIALMVSTMLKMKHYRVETLSDPSPLMERLSSLKPKCLLMDMLLSGTDGRDLCRSIKAAPALAHTKVIMMSAHPDAEVTCLRAGSDYFIPKPFEMKTLLAKVAEAVRGS